MTKLAILSQAERLSFDSPPRFEANERSMYFSLTNSLAKIIDGLRTPTNKVGFLLQLGYFKASGKFFTSDRYHQRDIEFVSTILSVSLSKVNLAKYQKKIPSDHRKRILKLQGWCVYDETQLNKISKHVKRCVEQYLSPKQVFSTAIELCWKNKIEIPSYNTLAVIITTAYNGYEKKLLKILSAHLPYKLKSLLNKIMLGKTTQNSGNRPPITLFKKINQSLRPSDICESVSTFSFFKECFEVLQPIIEKLNLSAQSTEYLATWVQKAKTFQLNQFPNKNKAYLHLIAFIKHEYYIRHDLLLDIFLKSVQASVNASLKHISKAEWQNRTEKNKSIKRLARTSKDSRLLISKISEVIKSSALSPKIKLSNIEALIDEFQAEHDEIDQKNIKQLEASLNSSTDKTYFEILESLSVKLQRRVSQIVKLIDFNPETSDSKLIDAIDCFKRTNGNLDINAPCGFMGKNEIDEVFKSNTIKVSLYKIILFIRMAEAIKSGNLNLRHSIRYKAIHEYLIAQDEWENNRHDLITSAGLNHFSDCDKVLAELKVKLDEKYLSVNRKFDGEELKYISIDDLGKVKVSTPKIEHDESEMISSLLSQRGYVPIHQVLSDIDQATNFSSCFKHFSIKHRKMEPAPETIYAGIIGKGCNIGVNRIANISIGISDDVLNNTVNWFFDIKNIQSANNKIINMINKLALSKMFNYDSHQPHTSSDGRKVNVAVDSLHANYSYKYFGKGKGVTIYTFIDEQQLLFHSTVISSSEREAVYVIDGLLQNKVIESKIHSTDTHGFTEAIFSATHFIGTSFAPRFKKVGTQNIYAFSTKKTYENRGYEILPSRTINQKLIINNWDHILRFMVTIKLKHTSASQLFKRLSSYAKDQPLYKSLKEFGRIIKSVYILTYYEDTALRQRIEKQLNKIELSNKFSKAIFFANNQEFKQGTKEEQEIAAACKVLIQNAIVLWNYLYLSQMLASNDDAVNRNEIINSIKKGSILTWHHVNLQGEYDFTKKASNDAPFDLAKILKFKISEII